MTDRIIGTDPANEPEIQVLVPPEVQEPLSRWLAGRGLYLFPIPVANDFRTFGIAPVTTTEEARANPRVPHYEAGSGIRPPQRGGKVRGVAREVVSGGGMELWACEHDHAPGVRDCRKMLPHQRAAAVQCAWDWIMAEIAAGRLNVMPVTRDGES